MQVLIFAHVGKSDQRQGADQPHVVAQRGRNDLDARGLRDGGALATVKHFPGQGRSRADTHRTTAVVQTPLAELHT